MKHRCDGDESSVQEPDAASTSESRSIKLKGSCTEYSTFFVVSLICLGGGFVLQLSDKMLFYQISDNTTVVIEYCDTEKTMIEFAPCGTAVLASCVLSMTASILGRKPALYLAAVCGLVSGVLFNVDDDAIIFKLMAKAFSTVIEMAAFTVCPMYMIEMVNDSTRGIFTAGCSSMIFVGMALEFCLEQTLPYSAFSGALTIISFTFLFLFFWLPESPYFLACKSKSIQAEKSLRWMRSQDSEVIKPELNEITAMVNVTSIQTRCSELSNVGMVKSLFLYVLKSIGGNVLILRGCDTMCSNSVISSAEVFGVIISLMSMSSFLGALAADRAGRKIMMYFSYGGSCITFIAISICIYFQPNNFEDATMVCFCLLSIFYGLGYGTITPLIALELTPFHSRCKMMAVGFMLEDTITISILMSHEPMMKMLGPFLYYLIPAVGNGLGLLIVWFLVPETLHQSLKDIQAQVKIDEN